MSETNYMVCYPVATRPQVDFPALQRDCAECSARVWISEGSAATAKGAGLRVVCWDCAERMGLFRDGQSPNLIGPEQMREIRDYLEQRDGRN